MKVILSIKPQYAEAIFSGKKKFEYRKSIFRKDVQSVVVYESSPCCRIIGEFFFDEILIDNPSAIWSKTHEHSGISHAFFDDYFQNRNLAYAIRISKAVRYSEPIPFNVLFPNCRPPQSFMYINE